MEKLFVVTEFASGDSTLHRCTVVELAEAFDMWESGVHYIKLGKDAVATKYQPIGGQGEWKSWLKEIRVAKRAGDFRD